MLKKLLMLVEDYETGKADRMKDRLKGKLK